MALTDVQIRAAKPGEKTIKLSDGNGLQLWVSPAGGKSWKLAYRFGGAQKKLPLGTYPAMGAKDARARAQEARALLADSVDPGHRRLLARAAKESSDAATFDVVAAELLAKKEREGRAEGTLEKKRWYYRLAKPFIGSLPISEISPADVLVVLRQAETKGNFETASKLRSNLGEVFRFAIATARATNDPTSSLRGALTAPIVTHRAAILDQKALGGLLRAVDGFEGQPTTRACLQLMALLYQRPGELRQAEWIEFDFAEKIWTIPAPRMKMRKPHEVPLPRQAIVVLEDLKAVSGHCRLVFPGLRTADRPISENTMNAALRRLGFAKEEMSSHGYRATASTLLNQCKKWSPDAVERAQARKDIDPMRGTYNRGRYWQERVEMAQWWADHLDTLRTGAEIASMEN